MYTSVLRYISSCVLCQRTKTCPHRRQAPLKPLEIVAAFGRVHLVFVGPSLQTEEGYQHLPVVVNSTMLWVESFPTKSTTAGEVAQVLYKEIISRYGVMLEILTDQGSSFKNKLVTELCKLLNMKHRFSSPRHPQTDRKAERAIQNVIRSLRRICSNQTEWANKTTQVVMSYRASVAIPFGDKPILSVVCKGHECRNRYGWICCSTTRKLQIDSHTYHSSYRS